MQAIITKYHPAGVKRGCRYSANAGALRISIQADPDWNTDRCHVEAVRKLCEDLKWRGRLVDGRLPDGSRVWVWTHFYQDSAHNPLIVETLNIS